MFELQAIVDLHTVFRDAIRYNVHLLGREGEFAAIGACGLTHATI